MGFEATNLTNHAITNLCSSFHFIVVCYFRHETCSANLLTCIRKGSGKEVAMAADTLARTLITVGYEGEPEKHMDYLGGAIWSAISKAKTAGAKAAVSNSRRF